jgi:hypothetical protein
MWQEQMLRARQRVLEQQAKSAVQIANKSAREVCGVMAENNTAHDMTHTRT